MIWVGIATSWTSIVMMIVVTCIVAKYSDNVNPNIEKAPVDAERERMLDLIEQLCANRAAIESQRPGIYGMADVRKAEALLREHDRLPKR